MDKASAREEIKRLISKYERVKDSNQIKKYQEEETKKDFILPLFRALGWDIEDKNEVSAEEHIISSGRVDYGFYINGRSKFYLEAKPLRADIYREEYADQAIKYSWNRGVTWAVLTDFETVKVFNAQDIEKDLVDKQYFSIDYDQYLNRIDQLWLLSKQAFEQDLIDKEAEKVGKKLLKVPVSELLFKDLNECRKILTDRLGKWNRQVPRDLLDEGVQKLLDRLIFIRVAEDRKIEQNLLIPMLNQWRTSKAPNKPELYESMATKFRELDETYNSNLFSPHAFEKWEDDGEALEKVIGILYGKKGYYEYDFSIMPADILGSVYENYLGYKLSQSQKGLTLDKAAGKRKEQGIYYTPTFIVDYIVRNALKPILDKCTSVSELKKIKVLDPACGSGSFLIKALEVILEKYNEFNFKDSEYLRIQIILDNLYGVDLDEQAVEIARLNLLINALGERGKLPSLDKNIKNGNSLISGTDEELKKYFGKNFKDKKPFSWEEKFPEVFKQGGFDVIIGNPPYIQLSMEDSTDNNLKDFLITRYKSSMGRLNTFGFFTKLGIDLLSDGGYLGFIIPNTILTQEYYSELRKMILESCHVENIVLLENLPFKDAVVENVILVLNKTRALDKDIKVTVSSVDEEIRFFDKGEVFQERFHQSQGNSFVIELNEKSNKLKDKLNVSTIPLGELLNINQGIALKKNRASSLHKEEDGKDFKPVLDGRNISRYKLQWGGDYLKYDLGAIHSSKDETIFLKNEKLLFRRVGGRLIATYDNQQFYALNTLVVMSLKGSSDYNINFFLALFNSKLLNYYYKYFLKSKKKVFSEIQARQVSQLPIKVIDFLDKDKKTVHDKLVKLTDKILDLNDELQKAPQDSNKWNSIKEEIERTDKKIDEEAYKLYNLTPEEIKIVENSNEKQLGI